MLNGRGKVGAVEVDWSQLSLAKRHQRKTIYLENEAEKKKTSDKKKKKSSSDEEDISNDSCIHIRELCLAEGGLGCALWDGSVILARWIYQNRRTFVDATVLELGAGCGLPGILAAKYAKSVILTEYIQQLVENLEYNITLNSDDDKETFIDENGIPIKRSIINHTKAGFLDWLQVKPQSNILDEINSAPNQSSSIAAAAAGEIKQANPSSKFTTCPKCTIMEFGKKFVEQEWYRCITCFPNDDSMGVCLNCGDYCHSGHELIKQPASKFRCDCDAEKKDGCDLMKLADRINMEIEPVDILLGAELTYNLLSITALINVIGAYLKPDGIFYEVLSNDRDGVSEFVAQIKTRGYQVHVAPVPAPLVGNYRTRDWTFQNTETYSFYSFYRDGCRFPMMN